MKALVKKEATTGLWLEELPVPDIARVPGATFTVGLRLHNQLESSRISLLTVSLASPKIIRQFSL